MGDVLQVLIDGYSGIAPGGVDGKALVAGVCSKGQIGKPYFVGKRSNLAEMLGVGPLVERLSEILNTAGQEPNVVAVPVAGQPAGYFGELVSQAGNGGGHIGAMPAPALAGYPARNADVLVRVKTAGVLSPPIVENGYGEVDIDTEPPVYAELEISLDGGTTFAATAPAREQTVIGDSGATLVFPADAVFSAGDSWAFACRVAVGPVSRIGDSKSPLLEIAEKDGGVRAAAEIVLRITKGGRRNAGVYQLSTDGGDNFLKARTIPVDGVCQLADYGVAINFPDGEYAAGTVYECRLLAPVPSIVDVLEALDAPLAVNDVEFVHIVGESDSVDWMACQAKAEELWNMHRPTYFKCESRLPRAGEDLSAFAAWLLAERQGISARFVTVCAQYGEVADAAGQARLRNAAGLQAGRVIAIPVQRATGRVKDGPISQLGLPFAWEAVQPALEEAGYLTAKKYNGLEGSYWADSRTLADDTSDYRHEEVLRTVFKAMRLTRIAALKSMYDEAGDPLRPNNENGVAYLKANLENALDTMVAAKELAAYVVDIPPGQDIVNNGVEVELSLIGIPIIRQITLYNRYIFAGSKFDPRKEEN